MPERQLQADAALAQRALLTTRQVAELLQLSTRTIMRLAESGDLPVLRIGTAVRFAPVDLQRWVDGKRDPQRRKRRKIKEGLAQTEM